MATAKRPVGRPRAEVTDRDRRLMPDGKPKWIRCYDDGGEGDRYTVVFTNASKTGACKQGGCVYLGMNAAPFHPQGIGQHGESDKVIDWPTYGHLGKRIDFSALPHDCQVLVLNDYCEMWKLDRSKFKPHNQGATVYPTTKTRMKKGRAKR